MKLLAIAIGTYNLIFWRALVGAGIGAIFFLARRSRRPPPAAMHLHIKRGLVGCGTMFLFFWGLARVPLAQGVALAFISPLITLYLANVLLGERIGKNAILASLLGLAGVAIILAGQISADLGPDALAGSISILAAAILYAWNLILMRQQALVADPVEVATFLALVALLVFSLAAPFLAIVPAAHHWPGIAVASILSFLSMILLSWAYGKAEAHYLAPVEYTALVWAALFGWLMFREPLEPATLAGSLLIIAGCLLAARVRPQPMAALEGVA